MKNVEGLNGTCAVLQTTANESRVVFVAIIERHGVK